MQNNVVMAFRKRLKKNGYQDISIRQVRNELGIPTSEYSVKAVEPLGGVIIHVLYTVQMMHNAFKGRNTAQWVYAKPPAKQDTAQQVTFEGVML